MNKEAKILLGIAGVVVVVLIAAGLLFGDTTPKDQADPERLVRADSQTLKAAGEEKVVLVEFSDFQCPACGAAQPTVDRMLEQFKDNVTFVYRHFPLRSHQHAELAAMAAEAAAAQGKFWEMHNVLFEKQADWGNVKLPLTAEVVRQKFIDYATQLGLDVEQFTQALDNQTYLDRVSADRADGNAINITATPTFFVNGYQTQLSDLETTIQAELDKK